MKKLRRQGATTYAGREHVSRRRRTRPSTTGGLRSPRRAPENFHLAVPRGLSLDTVFRLQEDRTISNDWVVRYDNRFFQLTRQSRYPPARSTVHVCEAADGHLEIRYRDRLMAWQEIATRPRVTDRPAAATARPAASAPRSARRGRSSVATGLQRDGARSRIWQGVDRVKEPMEAAGAVDAQNAPTAPWKTTEQFSTSSHRRPRSLVQKGTFLSREGMGIRGSPPDKCLCSPVNGCKLLKLPPLQEFPHVCGS